MKFNDLIKRINQDNNLDFYSRIIKGKFLFKIAYFSSISNSEQIIEINRSLIHVDKLDDLPNILINNKIEKRENDLDYFDDLYNGCLLLFFEEECICSLDVKEFNGRSIIEPEYEKSTKGARDGFTESISVNISLIRMRIKSLDLVVKKQIISKESKVMIALVYMNNLVENDVLLEVKKRLSLIELESLIMTDRALEECLFSQEKSILPLVRYTERPDIASINLMRGKIVLIVDTSSSVMIFPTSLVDHLRHVEEYRQNPLVGMCIRFLRYVSYFLSNLMLPLSYLMIVNCDIENIFSYNVKLTRLGLGFQFITGWLTIEVFRIAVIHSPSNLISTLSIVMAIILGEVALSLGLFTKEVLLVLALSTIGEFIVPSSELVISSYWLSFFLLIISIIFNRVGFLISLLVLIIYFSRIKILSKSYLSPFIPFNFCKLKEEVIRKSAKKRKKV